MNTKIFYRIVFTSILTITFFISCGRKPYYATPEEAIQANTDYMNSENLEGVMSTIHPESDSYEITENLVTQLFKVYDLNYKIEKLEVVDEDKNESVVNFTQLTTKINGPKFRDNRVKGTHILKKDGNSWKIFSTKITDTEFLN